MGKLGVRVSREPEATDAEPMTAEQGQAMLAELLAAAGARVLLGAKVLVFDSIERLDVVVFEDGRRFVLGMEVGEKREGDGIVAAAQKASPAARAAVTPGPGFETARRLGPYPDGTLPATEPGPWIPLQVEGDKWAPWCDTEHAFEAERRYATPAGCQERCSFLNRTRPEIPAF